MPRPGADLSITRKRILALLAQQPMTSQELAAAIPVVHGTADQTLQSLRIRQQIYVAEWRRTGSRGPYSRVWALGQQPDAPRPKPLSSSQKCKAWRKRGGDSHLAEKMRAQAAKIAASSTLAGMLGVATPVRPRP